jgi:hypothetical protein
VTAHCPLRPDDECWVCVCVSRFATDVEQGPGADPRDPLSPRAADRGGRPRPDGLARGVPRQPLPSRRQPSARGHVGVESTPSVTVGADLGRGGRRAQLRHRRDLGAALGRRLNMRGHDRDPLASSRQRSGATRGGAGACGRGSAPHPGHTGRGHDRCCVSLPLRLRCVQGWGGGIRRCRMGRARCGWWYGAGGPEWRSPAAAPNATGSTPGARRVREGGALGGPAADGCRLVWACRAAPTGPQQAAAGAR